MPGEYFSIPDHIHPLLHDGGVVLLNAETGRYEALDRMAGSLLELVNESGDTAPAAAWMHTAHDMGHAAAERLVLHWADSMVAADILATADQASPRHLSRVPSQPPADMLEGDVVFAMQDAEEMSLTAQEHTAALKGLEVAAAFLQRPFKEALGLVADAKAAVVGKASLQTALRCKAAIVQVSKFDPARVACIEEAAATTVMAASLEVPVAVDMCIGIGVDPIRFHAWPEVDGVPIRFEQDDAVTGLIHKILQV